MVTAECPGCTHVFNIDPKREGFQDDVTLLVECPDCEKTFFVTVLVIVDVDKTEFEDRYNRGEPPKAPEPSAANQTPSIQQQRDGDPAKHAHPQSIQYPRDNIEKG